MITVRFFAAAREAAGASETQISAGSLADLLNQIGSENPHLARVLQRCSFLVDGLSPHDREVALVDGSTVDVLPPFAGG